MGHKGSLGLYLENKTTFRIWVIVVQIGTKYHWVNPLQNFKHNYVNVFEKYLCIKTVVTVIFR